MTGGVLPVVSEVFVEEGGGISLCRLPGHADKACGGGIYLKAALSAAGTLNTAHADDLMTQLRTRMVGACVYLPVDYYAGAHTGAKGDAHSIHRTLCGTCHKFAVGSGIGIVCHVDRLVYLLLYEPSHRHIVEIKVVGVGYGAVFIVRNARCAYAYPFYVVNGYFCFFARHQGYFCHIGAYLLCRAGAVGLYRCLSDNIVVLVHHTRLDVGAAQVYANVVFHF